MSKVHKMKKHSIEYMYLSVPVNVGYKLLDKKGFTVTPYFIHGLMTMTIYAIKSIAMGRTTSK